MDERELVLTSLIYPLIFREAAQIGIATPIAAHIRELLKIQTPEPEVTRIGLPVPVTASIRNLYQTYNHPLQDFAQIGVAKPVGAHFKNAFNEYIHPHSDFAQIGNATPVSLHQVNLLKNLQTFKTDHVVQVSNAIPEAVYSTCKPVVFAPTYLRGAYIGESIQLYWSNNSITHSHQNLYRSTTPFTESSLPPVYQYIFRGVNSYIDEDIVEGVTYYYAVSTEAGLVQLVSDVTEVKAVVSSNCDPYWDKVVSLLHFDGDLTDEREHTWSQSASGVSFGDDGSSIPKYVDLATSSSVQRTVSMALPSTLEFTWRPLALAGSGYASDIIGFGTQSNCTDGFYLIQHGYSGRSCHINIGNGYRENYSTGFGLTAHTDYHIALQFNLDGTISLYIDGNLIWTETRISSHIDQTKPLTLNNSRRTGSVQQRGGRFRNLRFTHGVARYAENFIPPTEPFPNFGCSQKPD